MSLLSSWTLSSDISVFLFPCSTSSFPKRKKCQFIQTCLPQSNCSHFLPPPFHPTPVALQPRAYLPNKGVISYFQPSHEKCLLKIYILTQIYPKHHFNLVCILYLHITSPNQTIQNPKSSMAACVCSSHASM